jgi:hypothetical protein
MPYSLISVPCPHCPALTTLLESTLREIVHSRQLSRRNEPFLNLVCPSCKVASEHEVDRLWRLGIGLIGEGPRTEEYRRIQCFSVVAQCGGNNRESLVEILAIRQSDTTLNGITAEAPTWNIDSLFCPDGHAYQRPDPNHIRLLSFP